MCALHNSASNNLNISFNGVCGPDTLEPNNNSKFKETRQKMRLNIFAAVACEMVVLSSHCGGLWLLTASDITQVLQHESHEPRVMVAHCYHK